MTYRNAKHELALLFPNTLTAHDSRIDSLRGAADDARGAVLGGFFARAGAAISGALQALMALPQRRAVQNELRTLSDRELSDIGLTRAEIPHLFDRDFASRQHVSRV